MSKRLQVLLSPGDLREFRGASRAAGTTLGEWVRRTLRRAARETRGPSDSDKLATIEWALRQDGPTADIGQMLEEIERGRDLR